MGAGRRNSSHLKKVRLKGRTKQTEKRQAREKTKVKGLRLAQLEKKWAKRNAGGCVQWQGRREMLANASTLG